MGGSSGKTYLSGSNTSSKKTGSSSGSGGGGQAGGAAPSDVCNITANGTLRSPNPTAVAALAVGAVLAVRVHQVNGVDVLQAVNAPLTVVGVIDTPAEQILLDCIAAGNQYQAAVTRIAGGAISVRITRI